MSSRRRSSNTRKIDFDVNIVPIVDCLTILLVFMLASGAFISLGVLEVGVSGASSEQAEKQKDPSIDVSLSLSTRKNIKLSISGRENRTLTIRKLDGDWNFVALNKELELLSERYPEVKLATLISDHEVDYRDIVRAMEATKKTHPEVLLGGF